MIRPDLRIRCRHPRAAAVQTAYAIFFPHHKLTDQLNSQKSPLSLSLSLSLYMYLCSCSVRFLIRTNQSLPKQFSRLLKRTHFDFLHNSSIPLLYSPLKAEISCGSSSFRIHQSNNASSTRRPVLCSLRSEHTMASQSQKPQSVHELTVKDVKGNDVDLSMYKGKVLLIVNVASQCGLTNSNYTELSKLYEQYKDKGLEILAFPCNQFGEQEPGNNDQILEFACTRFKAEFPIFDKVDVNGDNAAPLYKFLKSSKGGLLGDSIKWNFSKFLVDKEGNVVDRYAPTTSPLSIEKDIKKLLGSG